MWMTWRDRTESMVHGIPTRYLAARRSDREAGRRRMGWHDDVVVATVANLRSRKDYPNLVEAAELAMAEEPRLRFVAIGQGPLEYHLVPG